MSLIDPRWQNLPHTDTIFTPGTYPNLETWEKEKQRLKNQILFAAGLWPMPEKPPLNARIWNRIERDGYTIEKVYFQSLPGFYVGGSLFRPIDPKPKSHPGVLAPHGHARLGRLNESEAASYQARGLTLARIGCTAFMWDMVDYNDSARHLSGAYEAETYGVVHRAPWLHAHNKRKLWNLSILGFQLWNSIRALDFLLSLPDVDPNRLSCTGESGGGTQTYNLYAVDDRLHVAAPVCMVSAYMQGGCVCENAPGLRIDTHNVDIGATFAPKPLLLVNSAQDWTKHTPDVEYPAIKKIYDLYDAGDKIAQVQIDAPHGYNKAMREAVYRWLIRWFDLPINKDYTEPPYQTEPRENLLAFIDGLPEGAIANHEDLIQQCIHAAQQNIDTFRPDTPERLAKNRNILGHAMRIAVGYTGAEATYQHNTHVKNADPAYEEATLTCQRRGIHIPIRTFNPQQPTQTLLLHPQGMNALYTPLLKTLIQKGHTLHTIDPFGMGRNIGEQNPEHPRGSSNFFDTFNRTDVAERVYEMAQTISHLLTTSAQTLNIVGFDEAGLWALLAGALLDPTQKRLRFIIDTHHFNTRSDADYLNRLFIPGILKTGGLPNAAALIVPHALLLHNTSDTFNITWANAAYALYPNTRLAVQKDRLTNDALIASLVG